MSEKTHKIARNKRKHSCMRQSSSYFYSFFFCSFAKTERAWMLKICLCSPTAWVHLWPWWGGCQHRSRLPREQVRMIDGTQHLFKGWALHLTINHLGCRSLQFFLRGFSGPESSARGKISTWSNVKQSATNPILATSAVNRKITSVHPCSYLLTQTRFTKEDGSRTTLVSEAP